MSSTLNFGCVSLIFRIAEGQVINGNAKARNRSRLTQNPFSLDLANLFSEWWGQAKRNWYPIMKNDTRHSLADGPIWRRYCI